MAERVNLSAQTIQGERQKGIHLIPNLTDSKPWRYEQNARKWPSTGAALVGRLQVSGPGDLGLLLFVVRLWFRL